MLKMFIRGLYIHIYKLHNSHSDIYIYELLRLLFSKSYWIYGLYFNIKLFYMFYLLFYLFYEMSLFVIVIIY